MTIKQAALLLLAVWSVLLVSGCSTEQPQSPNSVDIFSSEAIHDTEFVQRRLDEGLDPNSKNDQLNNSDFLITYAVRRGAVETVQLLIESGANLDARSDGYNKTPLFQAAYAGRTDIAALLIDNGADASAIDDLGNNALREAILGRHPEMVSMLLAAGADQGQENNEGQTMIDIARLHSTPEIVQILEQGD